MLLLFNTIFDYLINMIGLMLIICYALCRHNKVEFEDDRGAGRLITTDSLFFT